MGMADNIFIQCNACKETIPDCDKFCPICGEFLNGPIEDADFTDQAEHYINKAAEDLIDSSDAITGSDVGKLIISGAASTAIAGISFIGIAAGIAAGIGVGTYRHFNNDNE